ncbi:MAG: hypothetical protein ACEB74_08360 [Desulfovibrio aminophilus]|jgi:predicted small lipoprotein YifL|uniref:hypothetical protein n=2 Tax=Desulfovibrio TaxID=872 RepID=UPI00040E3192|nr:hypothetical protein [Desulfovibrio aminophilus]MDY0305658.1 hypothetical protein [Desulfovibrionaceae bacterium]
MIRTFLAGALVLAALLSLTACGAGRVVPLDYYAAQVTPPRCSTPVVVQKFTDARGTDSLGTNKDGQTFLADPGQPVADWVSYALYQELKANGCQALYQTVDQGSPNLIVRGEVLEVNLKQKDTTGYSCALKVRMRFIKNGKEISVEQFGSQIDKVYLPSSDNPRKALRECLQVLLTEVMENMLPKLKTM